MVAQCLPFQAARFSLRYCCYHFISHQQLEGTQFSKTPSAFIVCRLFADGHDWCELKPFWRLDTHVANNSLCWALGMSYFFFSFFLKWVSTTSLLLLISWKVSYVLNFLAYSLPQGIFWVPVSFTTVQSLWLYKQPLALGLKVLFLETATRRQHYYVLKSCY